MQDQRRRSQARIRGTGAMTAAGSRAPHRPAIRPGPSPWAALALLASAQLMLVLDVTVVNVALPAIDAALHLHRSDRHAAGRVVRRIARTAAPHGARGSRHSM
jgi:hypothetical protein